MKYIVKLEDINIWSPEDADKISEAGLSNVLLLALAERLEKLVEGLAVLTRDVNRIMCQMKSQRIKPGEGKGA